MTEKEIDSVIEGLEIIQEQYLEKAQKQYREVEDIKEVSLFEWEILDRAIKELKRERAPRQDEGKDKRSEDYVKREDVIQHICESQERYKDACKGRQYKRCQDILWLYDLPSLKI